MKKTFTFLAFCLLTSITSFGQSTFKIVRGEQNTAVKAGETVVATANDEYCSDDWTFTDPADPDFSIVNTSSNQAIFIVTATQTESKSGIWAQFCANTYVSNDACIKLDKGPVTKTFTMPANASAKLLIDVASFCWKEYASESVTVVAYDQSSPSNTFTFNVKFNYNDPTAINSVESANKTVVKKELYNTLGQKISTPSKGVNILVTFYKDGSKKSERFIK